MNEAKISSMQSSLARENFRTVLNRVEHQGEVITFTRHGEAVAVILPVDLYERLTAAIPVGVA